MQRHQPSLLPLGSKSGEGRGRGAVDPISCSYTGEERRGSGKSFPLLNLFKGTQRRPILWYWSSSSGSGPIEENAPDLEKHLLNVWQMRSFFWRGGGGGFKAWPTLGWKQFPERSCGQTWLRTVHSMIANNGTMLTTVSNPTVVLLGTGRTRFLICQKGETRIMAAILCAQHWVEFPSVRLSPSAYKEDWIHAAYFLW